MTADRQDELESPTPRWLRILQWRTLLLAAAAFLAANFIGRTASRSPMSEFAEMLAYFSVFGWGLGKVDDPRTSFKIALVVGVGLSPVLAGVGLAATGELIDLPFLGGLIAYSAVLIASAAISSGRIQALLRRGECHRRDVRPRR